MSRAWDLIHEYEDRRKKEFDGMSLEGAAVVSWDWQDIDLALWSIEDLYKDARAGRTAGNTKCFELQRKVDVSGISGTGIVAEGVEFPNGKVLIKWLGSRPSLVLWQSMEDAVSIHGHGGHTDFVYTIPGT